MFLRLNLADILPDSVLPSFLRVAAPPKPYTLPHLAAFIASHEPTETYDWDDGAHCLLAQYAKSVQPGHHYDHALYGFEQQLGSYAAVRGVAIDHPRTFGGALQRLRAVMV